jgi:SAM-dependent methyltransferase
MSEWRQSLAAGQRTVRRAVRRSLGLQPAMDTEDRRVLGAVILQHYRTSIAVDSLLFVGTRWYTRHYAEGWGEKRFVTLDVDPAAARFGAQHHVTASAADVALHLAPGSFDAVIFNGVYGWGMNDADDVQRALLGFHQVLRPRGHLVFGWNDVPARIPFAWHELPAMALFEPLHFAPLGCRSLELPTDNRHRFDFFARAG